MTTAERTDEDFIIMPEEPEPTPDGWDEPRQPDEPMVIDHDDIILNPAERLAARVGDALGRHGVRGSMRDRADERIRESNRKPEPDAEPETAPTATSTPEAPAAPVSDPPGRYKSRAEKDADAVRKVAEKNDPAAADGPAARRSPIVDKDAETEVTPKADPEPPVTPEPTPAAEPQPDPAAATTEHTPVAPDPNASATTETISPEGPRSLGALPLNYETPPRPSYEEAQARGPQERHTQGTAEILMNVKNPNHLTIAKAQELVDEAYTKALDAEWAIIRESNASDERADELQGVSQDATKALRSAMLAVNHLRARTGMLGEGLASERTFRAMNGEITAKAQTDTVPDDAPASADPTPAPDAPKATPDTADTPAAPKSAVEKEAQELIDYYKADKPTDEDLQQFNQIIGKASEDTRAAIKNMIEQGKVDDEATVAAAKEQLAALKMLYLHGQELRGNGPTAEGAWQIYEQALLNSVMERPADPESASEPEPTYDPETGKAYGSASNMLNDAVRLSLLKAGIDPEAMAEGRVRGATQRAYQRVIDRMTTAAEAFYKEHNLDPNDPLGMKMADQFEHALLPPEKPPVPEDKQARRDWAMEYGNGGVVPRVRMYMKEAHMDPEQLQADIADEENEAPDNARAV